MAATKSLLRSTRAFPCITSSHVRYIATSVPRKESKPTPGQTAPSRKTTHFGFREIPEDQKETLGGYFIFTCKQINHSY